MPVEKVKCIYCGKKIVKKISFCTKCGKDIRSMWEDTFDGEPAVEKRELFCPNPKCHAPYIDGDIFCIQCRNDYSVNPPIEKSDFKKECADTKCVYCPECGAFSDNDDIFCDCGCDFRAKPKVASPPKIKKVFYCSDCGLKEVPEPDGICVECRQKAKTRRLLCPECKVNPISVFGEICEQCRRNKPMRGMGEGFHFPK
ncbi:MAG: hypothetical protein ACI4JN_12000 [Ruminococcus sp.]